MVGFDSIPSHSIRCHSITKPYTRSTVSSAPIPPYRILSYPILSVHIGSYPILPYRIISYPILPYRIISYRITSHRIISYRITSYRRHEQLNRPTYAPHPRLEPQSRKARHFGHNVRRQTCVQTMGYAPITHTNQLFELAMMLENVFLALWDGGGACPEPRVAYEWERMGGGKHEYQECGLGGESKRWY